MLSQPSRCICITGPLSYYYGNFDVTVTVTLPSTKRKIYCNQK